MMYQMKVNQYERLSRKQRIRDSIQMFHHSFNEPDQYLPAELRTPTRKVSTRSDDRRMFHNEDISNDLFADDNDENQDKAQKTKRSKKPKQHNESSGIPDNDDDDEQSISLDQIYEDSPAQTHCTLNVSMNDDDFYMSDITDSDEDEPRSERRTVKRKKSTKQRRRRSKSGESLGEFDSSRRSVKEKRRPRSAQNLGDSAGVKKSSRRKKKSRSLDPAPRSLHNSISKSLKSATKSLESASKLRRPRDSMEKNEKLKRSKSESKGKRKGRKTTRRKSEKHCSSVTSDETPSSESFELLSETIDKFDSMRSLRRPRNSLLVTNPTSMKERRKPKSERNKKSAVDRMSSWHNSTSF